MTLVGSDLNCALHLGSFLKLHATESFCETEFFFELNEQMRSTFLVFGL